jgi:cytochrome P450
VALTWLWVVLDAEPDIAARLYAEVDAGGPARYTRMVMQELLRLYPVGWIIPRTVLRPDTIDGVPIEAGATIVLSPFLTHRLPDVWPRPLVFDPERFAGGEPRRRFAYFPFSGGPHQCLGSHFFTVEAQLVVSALLRRFRPVLCGRGPVGRRAAVTLRPRRPVTLLLNPRVD